MRTAKAKTRLCGRAVWSGSSLPASRVVEHYNMYLCIAHALIWRCDFAAGLTWISPVSMCPEDTYSHGAFVSSKINFPEEINYHMNRNVGKRTSKHVRPANIQISQRIHWSESSLSAFRIANDAKFLYAQVDLSLFWAHVRKCIVSCYAHTVCNARKVPLCPLHTEMI